jgi:GMP synthase (glutamine-hydrolysing)
VKILVIMHVESEGPGTLGTFLESQGAQLQTARLYAGEDLPQDVAGLAAVISMGGPMNVYDEATYPFLRSETVFLERALDADIPILGVCLGSQMIARAAGARVRLGAVKEVGWGTVTLSDGGASDAFFRGLPGTFDVFQWHEDMFEIPAGGTLLASSEICPHQAFSYHNALGLQFHVEVTADILERWFADSPEHPVTEIRERYHEVKSELDQNARQIYRNFVDRIAETTQV